MQTVFLIRKGQIVSVEADVSGPVASIPLAFGAVRRIFRPRWYPTHAEASAALQAAKERALERARKLLEEAKAA